MTTMDSRICPRTDLPAYSCAHCRGLPWNPPRDETTVDIFSPGTEPGPWFKAAFPGRCARCGRQFVEGELIRRDGRGAYECCDERLNIIGGA